MAITIGLELRTKLKSLLFPISYSYVLRAQKPAAMPAKPPGVPLYEYSIQNKSKWLKSLPSHFECGLYFHFGPRISTAVRAVAQLERKEDIPKPEIMLTNLQNQV